MQRTNLIKRNEPVGAVGRIRFPVPPISASAGAGDSDARTDRTFSPGTDRGYTGDAHPAVDAATQADPFLSATPFIAQFIAQERTAPLAVDPRRAVAAYAKREERYDVPTDLIDAA